MAIMLAAAMVLSFAACKKEEHEKIPENEQEISIEILDVEEDYKDAVILELFENGATVDGKAESDVAFVGGEIIYYHDMEEYPSGNKYGEGDLEDRHSEEEAAEYTLVTIKKPGEYLIKGSLKGQLAVDLGEEAKTDPDAKVTLIFAGADISCKIAPAVIFYNVYECADGKNTDEKVDTSKAGATLVIADGTENNIKGANVAKIFKDDENQKKLHKYDGALYSKMSMNIKAGAEGTGILNVEAKNEGIGSEMHLSIFGGNIFITSDNDGINTNEDGVSVTTINGGELNITVNGETGEGDGIDSNGWIVINGGVVVAQACSFSADSGIDSDMGIHINGGTVIATGSMLDRIEGGQNYAVFNFMGRQNGGNA
ncbi:MAG: carbohydrate-binding domain-containing protein, partial [Oscillospiraceae bacterium]|nr:carbohydrate-binding domain-containing protein [Oscillospiraceae bacterium]